MHSTSHRQWKTLAGSQQLMPAVKLMWLEQVLKAQYCLSWWWCSDTGVIRSILAFLILPEGHLQSSPENFLAWLSFSQIVFQWFLNFTAKTPGPFSIINLFIFINFLFTLSPDRNPSPLFPVPPLQIDSPIKLFSFSPPWVPLCPEASSPSRYKHILSQ